MGDLWMMFSTGWRRQRCMEHSRIGLGSSIQYRYWKGAFLDWLDSGSGNTKRNSKVGTTLCLMLPGWRKWWQIKLKWGKKEAGGLRSRSVGCRFPTPRRLGTWLKLSRICFICNYGYAISVATKIGLLRCWGNSSESSWLRPSYYLFWKCSCWLP